MTVQFQLLVDIPDDGTIANYLVLPPIFKNKLSRNCMRIRLVDSRGVENRVSVEEFGVGSVRIGNDNWPVFVGQNVLVNRGITKLCFRLLRRNVFEVLCFNSTGKEMIRNNAGQLVMRRCLVEASETTVHKEYFPLRILNGMNQDSLMMPIWKAKLYGPKQIADVDVIYQYYQNNQEGERWRAVGFKGSQWTNFVMVNGIEKESTMMITYLGDQNFMLDVFNQNGIGVALFDSTVEDDPDEVYDDEVGDGDFVHRCRVTKHRHHGYRRDYFMIKFPEHPLTTRRLTVPAYFVREQNMFVYTRAVILFGHLKFKAKMSVQKDVRRAGDLTHVHIIRDWNVFLKETGLIVGDPVLFELIKDKSVIGGVAWFRVC